MRASKLFTSFFESEKTGGILLLFCAIFSILVSNSAIGKGYIHLWEINLGGMSLEHIVNDGLMTIFFLMIGLELEREIYIGELSSIKNASLPIIAAVGGMILPAIVYFLLTRNTEYEGGFGVPMATDIAFAVGILSLIGKKVPVSLKIFLTALAVIDDLGALDNWIVLLKKYRLVKPRVSRRYFRYSVTIKPIEILQIRTLFNIRNSNVVLYA